MPSKKVIGGEKERMLLAIRLKIPKFKECLRYRRAIWQLYRSDLNGELSPNDKKNGKNRQGDSLSLHFSLDIMMS